MPTTDVPVSAILHALDRAARFRRSQVTDPRATPVQLVNDVTPIPGQFPIRLDPDGWATIGSVVDGFAGAVLVVRWQVETDRVRVEHPPEYEPPALPARALYPAHSPMGSAASTPKPFVALPGFVFTFEGIDHDQVAAERLTAERGSLDGWSWRPEPCRNR